MEQIRVKNQVGYVSLVGFMEDKFPMKHGNYFSLGGYHVLNMWYENFKHLNLNKEYIDAVKFGDKNIVIVDADIPDDYLNNEPCFTGGGRTNPEINKEIYEFMFPKFKELKCMCCESAKYVSVYIHSYLSNRSGISLSRGACEICSRKILLNNKFEVSQEIYDKLQKIWHESPSEANLFLAPYQLATHIEVDDWKPDAKLLSRYAKKRVNQNYYGIIKISDLKEQENKNENENEEK